VNRAETACRPSTECQGQAMSHVFISHRSTDKSRFRQFVLRLADRRVPSWIDNYEQFNVALSPGEARIEAAMLAGGIRKARDWPVEIDVALLNSSVVVLFWSRAWQLDRAALAREHGIALARHRANAATYIPVFLDDPADLPPELLQYRADSGDLVQAFNVARFGQDQWTALVDAVESAWRSRVHFDATNSIANVVAPTDRADWKRILNTARTEDDSVRYLLLVPEGPAVDVLNVSSSLIRAFANGTNATTAPDTVNIASRLVLTALGASPTNRQAYVVTPADLPAPDRGVATYWAQVFTHACLLGPRMLAALLLAAPVNVLRAVHNDAAKLLATLEVWS
jgi:hypothetical protein